MTDIQRELRRARNAVSAARRRFREGGCGPNDEQMDRMHKAVIAAVTERKARGKHPGGWGQKEWTQILTDHSGVSGMTRLEDGTKVYWTEGRGSDVVAVMPNGRRLLVDGGPLDTEEGQFIWAQEQRVEEEGADESRVMTAEEEVEWEKVYYPE